ncbi:MAG: xanthine dehydrogenase family protein molybdopterin-binding subunit [Gemmatimonadaceae bacterium]|nr:xanthine dehydrogenase family protein molybdopterin-binding subunit [Gemmatimonadaceae bacterium]
MSGPNERQGRRFVSTVVEVEGRREVKVVELPAHDPAPWDADASLSIVGQRVPRVDAREKVTGRATFTTDIQRPGMLHAALVRAPIARGTVTSIDAAAALRLSGVADVITGADLPRPIRAGGLPFLGASVTYPGQPVAAVCAESRHQAIAAARAVRVTYEAAPFAITFEDATAPGAPSVRGGNANTMRGSPIVVERGDVDAALATADVIVRREYRTPSQLHSPLEPHAAVAEWDGDRLTVWESTQGVFRVRDELAKELALPKSHVRVIKDYMGGGFGGKNNSGTYTFAAAVLARRTGRAVRCVFERDEEQMDGGHRAPSRQVVTLGARRDGRLVAIDVVAEVALGATGWEGGPAAIFRELYSCPNVRTHETFAYVNTQPMMSFRAPGHVEGAFALERTMDVLARELGLDPLALRLVNFAERDESADRPYSANGLRRCYEEGAKRFGWGAAENADADAEGNGTEGKEMVTSDGRGGANVLLGGAPQPNHTPPHSPHRAPPHARRRGVGMAACVWGAGGGPPAYATVRLNNDASVDVLSGTQDLGTGSRTVLAQVAAESLGARLDDVRVILGDTERTPYAGNSWGSMTTASVGPAVRAAAEEARQKLLEAASEMLECHADDLTARDSTITTRDGARRIAFADVTRKLGNVMIMGQGSRGPNPENVGLMSFGAHFAEVEVDIETGVVRLLRIVAAHDAGRIINPMLAESQLHGGILQGMGFALFEERHLDPHSGRPVNPSFHDYKIPTIADLPEIDAFCVEGSDTVANHLGARGLAEPPIIPVAPAIANAVADALGIEVRELPLTPWRILTALREG